MNKGRIILVLILLILLIPTEVKGDTVWTGNGVYYEDYIGEYWGVKSDEIEKVLSTEKTYALNDIQNYSAYISNRPKDIGNLMEESFYWFNKSRLAYVKLFEITPGQEISFLFSENFYVYCAQYNEKNILIDDGVWLSTGEKYKTSNECQWIMIVLRQFNGDSSNESGIDLNIELSDVINMQYKYIIFQPFTYTLNLNGGSYESETEVIKMNRLGVEAIELPVPEKAGYEFVGWRASDGILYKGTLPTVYNSALFQNTQLDAQWVEKEATYMVLNQEYVVMEQNIGEQIQLSATIYPEDTLDKTLEWTSSNTEIATVNQDGKITAHHTGKAIITATTSNGIKAVCTVYVMGFEVTLPNYCNINDVYEIKVEVYNNGVPEMGNQKNILISTEESIDIVRVGDATTDYKVTTECSNQKDGEFVSLKTKGYLLDTKTTQSIFYRIIPNEEMEKAGDYQGNVTFTVNVQ